jgi:hypothetical protein
MVDREPAAVSRYKLESQELLRAYRGLAWQLEVVDRELERSSDPDRRQELREKKKRITGLSADTKARLRACWDRSRTSARRLPPRDD